MYNIIILELRSEIISVIAEFQPQICWQGYWVIRKIIYFFHDKGFNCIFWHPTSHLSDIISTYFKNYAKLCEDCFKIAKFWVKTTSHGHCLEDVVQIHASTTVFTRLGPPAVFFLLTKLETSMKENRFTTIEEIKEKSKQELLAIPKSVFQKCVENWRTR